MEAATRVYTPGEAALELGVTTNTLRRYADDYAVVFEAIPQRGRQRVFDDVILGRLRAAQALQQANRAPSVLAALEMVRDGAEQPGLATGEAPPFEGAVLERLSTLAEMVGQMHRENNALHARLNALEATPKEGRALPPQAPAKVPQDPQHGPLVRAALWLESRLKRLRP